MGILYERGNFWNYLGYYHDYKRNHKEFIRIIMAMPMGIIAANLCLVSLFEK